MPRKSRGAVRPAGLRRAHFLCDALGDLWPRCVFKAFERLAATKERGILLCLGL